MERMLVSIPEGQNGRLRRAFALYGECPTCHLEFVESLGLRMARLGKVSCDMAAARAADTITAFNLLLLGEDQLIYCLRRLELTLEAFTAMEERQARLRTRVETVTRMYEYSGRHHTYVTNILLRRESAFLEYRICNYSEIYDAKPELQIDVEYDMPIFASQCRDLLHGQAVLNGRRSTECADTTITLAHAMIEATEYLSGQLAQECAEYEEHEDLASYVKDLARTWTAGSADVATLLRCVCGARMRSSVGRIQPSGVCSHTCTLCVDPFPLQRGDRDLL